MTVVNNADFAVIDACTLNWYPKSVVCQPNWCQKVVPVYWYWFPVP